MDSRNIGQKIVLANGQTIYEGGQTENGICYKDFDAWKTGEGIIYLNEYELNEGWTGYSMNWRRDSWLYAVGLEMELSGCNGFRDDKFVETIAEKLLELADWQGLSTLLDEFCYNEDFFENNWKDWQNQDNQ